MTGPLKYLAWFVAGFGVIYLVLAAISPQADNSGMRLDEFGQLPVVDHGRIKPIDTVARTSLMVISNRQTFVDSEGKEQPAVKWLLDVMTSNPDVFPREKPAAEQHKVFRIENLQLLGLLDLEHRPGKWRYSVAELAPKFSKLREEAERADKVDEKHQELFQQKVLELWRHLVIYMELSQWRSPHAIPPASGTEDWRPLLDALREAKASGQPDPATLSFARMLLAYADNKASDFNSELTDYRNALEKKMPAVAGRADFETFFNRFAPFYHCSVLYVFVLVLACVSWIGPPGPLNRAAFWLALVTLAVHTWAIGARMYIQGRPPVTNLYSSAVFIGWGSLVIALILEAIFRNGIGNVMAAVLGSLTMLIAHHLAASGDTLEMMQAVLDTNFWLATHVTCVTLGYAATFMAGFLGILFVVLGLWTPRLDKNLFRSLSQMIYGIVCFATLLSFTGTVLGGIWADQSWGRFWGWDPKENGALLIVLWNALILHSRWAGLVKQRGMAVLAIIGNMVTGWSWFGTNQLGVGLHAYGFNNTLATGLTIFWATQLAFIGMGLVPMRLWRSFADQGARGASKLPRGDKALQSALTSA
jgi:ABC-type transport system involved in cytochrome c biogenesis permease subunit